MWCYYFEDARDDESDLDWDDEVVVSAVNDQLEVAAAAAET